MNSVSSSLTVWGMWGCSAATSSHACVQSRIRHAPSEVMAVSLHPHLWAPCRYMFQAGEQRAQQPDCRWAFPPQPHYRQKLDLGGMVRVLRTATGCCCSVDRKAVECQAGDERV